MRWPHEREPVHVPVFFLVGPLWTCANEHPYTLAYFCVTDLFLKYHHPFKSRLSPWRLVMMMVSPSWIPVLVR